MSSIDSGPAKQHEVIRYPTQFDNILTDAHMDPEMLRKHNTLKKKATNTNSSFEFKPIVL